MRLWLAEPNPSAADIERQLQGNLCRCTGYEPIVKAAIAAAATIPDADNDRLVAAYDATTEAA
jgi:xanthine dehydrogenase small subunit